MQWFLFKFPAEHFNWPFGLSDYSSWFLYVSPCFLLAFSKASSLNHWESQVKSVLWEQVLSPCITEVLRKMMAWGLMYVLWREKLRKWLFLSWNKDKLSLQVSRFLAIPVTDAISRKEFTPETLFLSVILWFNSISYVTNILHYILHYICAIVCYCFI